MCVPLSAGCGVDPLHSSCLHVYASVSSWLAIAAHIPAEGPLGCQGLLQSSIGGGAVQ